MGRGRLLPETPKLEASLVTGHAYLQGFFTGATGLEPATSGVTGRSWRFRAERG